MNVCVVFSVQSGGRSAKRCRDAERSERDTGGKDQQGV